MLIFEDINPIKTHLLTVKCKRQSIGFVPTMGALHLGHISLIKASKAQCDITVCSIYVNPTQFNNESDLVNYPKVLDKDIEFLKNEGCDILFVPSDGVMYQQKPGLFLNFGRLENIMEGNFREGHFNGVGLIVAKLLNIIQPTNAYFGQKDLQQFLIIKQLVKDFSFDVNLYCMPIVREPDGLAMSSRNLRLSIEDRKDAIGLYGALKKAQAFLLEYKNVPRAKEIIKRMLADNEVIKLEYFEILDSNTLNQVVNLDEHQQVSLFIAGYLGEIRLIDNIYLH
ncbi:MAG: pantoate--beta-alanine ligase [Bacteroidota bacterium]|nr:pantoate--beta-alanine ligase [Bacteroidota bacterium]